MSTPHVNRVIHVYEFDDGTFDATDSALGQPLGEDSRVTSVTREAAADFVNAQLGVEGADMETRDKLLAIRQAVGVLREAGCIQCPDTPDARDALLHAQALIFGLLA